jgi:hypothetical protein
MRRHIISFFLAVFLLAPLILYSSRAYCVSEDLQQQHDFKQDRKNAGFMEKQLERLQQYLDMDSLKSARRAAENAEKYYGKISDRFRVDPEVMALKARMDTLGRYLSNRESGVASLNPKAEKLLPERIAFARLVKPYLSTYRMLEAGKTGAVDGYVMGHHAKLDEGLPEFKAFEAEFRRELALLIEEDPGYSHDCVSVDEFLDAFKNADKYRKMFGGALNTAALDRLITELGDEETGLIKGDPFPESFLDVLYGPLADAPFPDVIEIQARAQKDGLPPLPEDKLNTIAGYKAKLRRLLAQTAGNHSWKSEKTVLYPYKNIQMEKLLLREAAKRTGGLIMVEYGALPEDQWRLRKNGLGIPLYRVGQGYALFQKEGEPFLRGYSIEFVRHFNGNDYDPVSVVKMPFEMTPCKD